MAKEKEYSNQDMTVIWKADTCIHSKKCWDGLEAVFNPNNRPWINMDGASTEAIKKQIDACPSGALSYRMNNGEATEVAATETKVDVLENGPLIVKGTILVTGIDGKTEVREKATAFCRCGASENKPYCDGKHKAAGFTG